jgi:hypothetical protein
MISLLRLLWIPLVIECINAVVHQLLRGNSEDIIASDIVSNCISAAVFFFIGWRSARTSSGIGPATFGALFIWGCSVAVTTLLLMIGATADPVTPSETLNFTAIQGFLLSALFVTPLVIGISVLGAYIGKRTRPSDFGG